VAFGQRRKMLRQSLKPLVGAGAEGFLARAGIDSALRAEAVDIEGFAALARALEEAQIRGDLVERGYPR